MSFISISFNPNMLKCPKNDQTHVKHLAAFKHVKHPLNARASDANGVFFVNFEHISHLILVFLLLTLDIKLPAKELLFGKAF